MDDYSSSVAKCLVGIVHVDISCLAFQGGGEARQIDNTRVQHLVTVFSKSRGGCEPDETDNQVSALISSRELDHMLENSQLTRNDLQKSLLGGGYPKLNTSNRKIYCRRGRHRLKAAEVYLRHCDPEDYWWTVRLYTFGPGNRYKATFLRNEAEHFSHETPYSDGEVYLKVRHYQRQSREDLADDWRIRLKTKSKRLCLSALLRHNDFVAAFDRLEPFPGMWKDFHLGNFKHDFALHSDEEFLHCLNYIYPPWNEITLGIHAIQQAADIYTVQGLQYRAPSASLLDRQYIIREMDRGAFFSKIVDRSLRQSIKEAILRLSVIIPSIKSYHQNANYFSIGAKIVQNQLLSKPIKTTMYKTMCSHWSAPENLLEETQEGEYRHVSLPEGESPVRHAYVQVLIAAQRCFSMRSNDVPLKEIKRKRKRDQGAAIIGGPVKAWEVALCRHAQKLGFRTSKIIDGLRATEDLIVEASEPFTENSNGETIERRSGKPFTNAYKQLRTRLFLRNLSQVQDESSLNPSVSFVQRDFLNAVFGWTSSGQEVTPPTAPIPLSEPAAPPEPVLPDPISPSEPDAAAASEIEVFVEPQPEIQTNNTPRGVVISPQSAVSSETLVISPIPRAYTESLEHWSQSSTSNLDGNDIELAEDWSQFSLPSLDESDSGDDQNRQQNQRERSLPRSPVDRLSLPAPEFDGDDEYRSFPTVDLQNIDILSTALTENSERRSFPEPEFRNGEDDRRLSETRGEDDERRSFPTADLQGDVWSPASTDNSGRRSFPALELFDVDVEGERRSFPVSEPRDEDDERRSFPAADLQDMDMLDNNRSFRIAEVQSTSAGDLPERPFPALEQPDRDVEDGRRSFPAPELHEAATSGRHQPHVAVEAQSSLTDRGSAVDPRPFAFVEYNGMRKSAKSTSNMEQYLQQRQGWTMMVLRNRVLKTIRFGSIVEYMRRQGSEKYFLIAPQYAEHFRLNHLDSTSSV